MVQQASRKPVFPASIAPYIDVAAYLIDARAPAATLFFDELLAGKELLLLTRAGQADAKTTARWQAFFAAAGYTSIVIDSLSSQGFPAVLDRLAVLLQHKLRLAKQRGLAAATLRVAALGVPNVGKSTFLNRLIGGRRLKTGDKPGITRGHQWVRLFEDVEVLDTPGILRDPTALNRRKPYWMLLNLMPYEVALREEAVELLREKLGERGLQRVRKFYGIAEGRLRSDDWLELLHSIGVARGFAVLDDDSIDRAARLLISDFRDGRFGRLSLQHPESDAITSPLFSAKDFAK